MTLGFVLSRMLQIFLRVWAVDTTRSRLGAAATGLLARWSGRSTYAVPSRKVRDRE